MHRTTVIMKTKARKTMKNFEKYKTALERSKALYAFCGKNTCDKCALGNLNRNVIDCQFAWLDLEAEKDEPMDCPTAEGISSALVERLEVSVCSAPADMRLANMIRCRRLSKPTTASAARSRRTIKAR